MKNYKDQLNDQEDGRIGSYIICIISLLFVAAVIIMLFPIFAEHFLTPLK